MPDDVKTEQAITAWRDRLSASPNISDQQRVELEDHLRCETEALKASGLNGNEAVTVAAMRVGTCKTLEQEFAKVRPWNGLLYRVQWMAVGFAAISTLQWLYCVFLTRPLQSSLNAYTAEPSVREWVLVLATLGCLPLIWLAVLAWMRSRAGVIVAGLATLHLIAVCIQREYGYALYGRLYEWFRLQTGSQEWSFASLMVHDLLTILPESGTIILWTAIAALLFWRNRENKSAQQSNLTVGDVFNRQRTA
ncbi:MAG: hypothetical protein AAF916_07205 [Planctomycetota bacterium]